MDSMGANKSETLHIVIYLLVISGVNKNEFIFISIFKKISKQQFTSDLIEHLKMSDRLPKQEHTKLLRCRVGNLVRVVE